MNLFFRKHRPAFLGLVFALTCEGLLGQSSLKGRIRDTASDRDCSLAVVALLQTDSALTQYTRSHKDGSFYFKNIVPGDYQLLITHPSYSEFILSIHITTAAINDLQILVLTPRADTLTPVIVTPRTLVPRLRGDTLEYNTAHIKTRINATVEELLYRLPGVQVDQDGNITVNGLKIEKLLVDGKDFFGGNPTLVTRNFNADMISKVQVLDKKSDQSEFTGVDDGRRKKTLNLVLKEDSKRGHFLKTEAGGAPQGYYSVNGLLGSFKGSRQLAAVGMTANTGATGFSSDVEGVGSMLNIGGGSDALEASAGTGIPKVAAGGLHYSEEWGKRGERFIGNYQYGRLVTAPLSRLVTSQILPDSIYLQQQQSASQNTQDQHGLNMNFQYAPDTVHLFNLYFTGNSTNGHNVFSSIGSSSFNDTLVNSSQRTIRSNVQNQGFSNNLMWQSRSKRKKERVFSIVMVMTRQENSTKGFLYSLNKFYKPGASQPRTDTTDQRKAISSDYMTVNGSFNYTEPLKKGAILALSYGLTYNFSQSKQATYGRGDGKYEAYIDSLSNHYQNNALIQQVTLNLQSQGNKLAYVIGGDLLHYSYTQTDFARDSIIRYQYLSFAPRINSRINIRPGKVINIDYNGSTQQPSIAQLQPVQNNNDPLHITLGNPGLHGSFSHRFGLRYASYAASAFTANLSFNLIANGISTKTYTDTLGRQVSQAVNVNGSYGANASVSFNKNIKAIDLNINFNPSLSFIRSVNYVNQYLSRNNNYTTGLGVAVSKFVPDKYNFMINSSLAYTYSSSSINVSQPLHYVNYSHYVMLSVFPLAGFEISTTGIYTWRQRLNNFDTRNSSILWNARIGKDLFKNLLNIRWQINDILEQNAGITRTSTANQTSESTVNIIGRYWMVTASWRLIRHREIK